MLSRKLYYSVKTHIPRKVQLFLRRYFALLKLVKNRNIWPIDYSAASPPDEWRGWPKGKKFALVLTHDVESAIGRDKCIRLMEIEANLGFRSSFNFVCGDYDVPVNVRKHIIEQGFEIGIHGLHHHGNLFNSKSEFLKQAVRINECLKEWKCVGFRTPSMYHNLEWIHHLDIEYDASTFDTDPFEPQPDGVGTIFPFWVPSESKNRGYVELPYTLPQDFLLFNLMKEKNIDIWKRKLNWIASNGGMVLVNTHPDYMNFSGKKISCDEYPVQFYEKLLLYIKEKYDGHYWNALPREVADFWKSNFSDKSSKMARFKKAKNMSEDPKKKIWVDLDNSPHVPFFKPIIDELNDRGYDLIVTARDCFQVCGLADLMKVKYQKIGKHYGKHLLLKGYGLLVRSYQLFPIVHHAKPDLAVSHGSRSQILLSSILNIPSMLIGDYEFSHGVASPTYMLVPEVIPYDAFSSREKRQFKYPGIKEDVYVPFFEPDPAIMDELGINESELIITIRPPATEAHYHNPESEILFKSIVDFIGHKPNTRIVILPRNEVKQTAWIKKTWSQWCATKKIIIPDHVVDGLNLIYYSDLVVSGGGTMNREAAAMGVPVYSIFRGKIGAVDRYLCRTGRLTLLESVADIEEKLILKKRDKLLLIDQTNKTTLHSIVDTIEKVINGKR